MPLLKFQPSYKCTATFRTHCSTQARTNVISALVNKTNLVHDLILVYFVNFIYNIYMFRTSPGPSSGGTTVFMRHWYLLLCIADCLVCRSTCSCIPDSQLYRITSTNPGPARKLSTNLYDIYHC